MARLLGEARVSVLPDGTRFKPEAEAAVKKATAGLSGKVKLNVNDNELMAKLLRVEAEIHKVISKQYNAKFGISEAQWNVQVAKIKADIEKLSAKSVNIKTALDRARFDQEAATLIAKVDVLSKKTVKVKINADLSGKEAEAEAVGLRARLNATLRNIKARVTVDRGSLRSAAGAILGFFGGNFTKSMEGAGNNGGRKLGGGFISGLGKSALMQNPGITAAVIAGLAALPAAVGAVGVLGGLALGAGLIFAAEKLIKNQIKTLTASIKTATTAAGKSAAPTTIASNQLAIQNTEMTIKRLEGAKKLTAAQQQQLAIAKQRLVIEKQTLATNQGTGGTAAQKAQIAAQQKQLAMWKQQQAAFNNLNAAVGRLKLGFTQFAIKATQPLLKPFTNAIDDLDRQLRGPLGKDFRNLFSAVAPLVKPVATSLFAIVHGILPGMADMLRKARKPLSDLFVGFGKIVGTNLGQWFRDAVPYIKASSKYFLMLLNVLGKTGSLLIKFGGEVARAFAGNQFKGMGKLIGQLAQDIIKLLVPAFEGWSQVMAPVLQLMLDIMVPVLNFLVKHPALVKAIAAVAAAWYLIAKAVGVVNVMLGIMDLELAPLGVVFVALAVIAAVAAYEIVKHWGPISRFFIRLWNAIYKNFIKPFTAGLVGFAIMAITIFKNVADAILSAIGLIIHGVASAFGWVPGLGGKLRSADAAFSRFHRSVDGHFDGMIKTMKRYQDSLLSNAHVAKVTSAQIAGSFHKQGVAAGRATADVDVLTGAIRSHGINSDQFHKARSRLISDMAQAGVKSQESKKAIGDYTGAVIAHGIKSDQAHAARMRIINDILAANKNSVNGKEDLDKYTHSVVQQGAKADATRRARAKLIDDLVKSGVDAKEARDMVDNLKISIGKLKSKSIMLTMKGNGTYAIGQAKARDVQHVKSPSGNFSAFIGHAATGAFVKAGTTSTADDVLVRVSKGELIVPANLVKAGAADHLRGHIPGFAKGGVVQDNKSVMNGTFPTKTYAQFAWEMTNTMADKMVTSINKALDAIQVAGGNINYKPSAGVAQWLPVVLQALALNHEPASLAGQVLKQISTESGGNPNAQNNTDINAQRGDPSRGLLQTIMSTFRAYHVAGTSSNIFDPLANIAAAINYARHVYGPGLMSGSGGLGSGHGYALGGLVGNVPHFAKGGSVSHAMSQKQALAAVKAARARLAAAQARREAAADAKRVERLELKSLPALRGLEGHYEAKLAKDARTGNYRDYFGTTLALEDVHRAIRGWKTPLQRAHDNDAVAYRHYTALAARARSRGDEKGFFTDSVKASKYAAAIARIDKKLNAQATARAAASNFVPLNIPLNTSYMTGFGQFGGQFRLGGTLREGIVGRGVKTGMSYMMGAGERVVPPNSTAANPGQEMAQTNQLLLSLLTELRTANQINRTTAQNTGNTAKGLGHAGRNLL